MARFLSNKPVHALIAVYMPMMMLITFVYLLQKLLNEITAFYIIYPVITGVITSFAASFYCDFMKDAKTGRAAADVRGGILVLFVSYIASSILINAGHFSIRMLMPNLHNFSACLAALYAWNAVISAKQLFSARKVFDHYTENYSGEQLQEAFSGDTSVLLFNDEEIARVRNSYVIQLVLACLLLLMTIIFQIKMSLAFYLIMILALNSVVCFFGFLEIFMWEQYYAGEGLSLPPFTMPRHMIGIGVLSITCTLAAMLLSSDKSVLKFSPIIDFIKWLLALLRRTPKPRAEMILDNNIDTGIETPHVESPVIPDIAGEIQGPSLFFKLLQYAFLAALAAGFLWFMLSPLLKIFKGSKLSFRKKLSVIIREWIKGVINAFNSFVAFIRNERIKQKLHAPSEEEIRRAAQNIFGAYSHAKKRDMRHSVTLFARLIIWGGEVRQVIWKPSHAPAEYCALLAASPPLDKSALCETDATADSMPDESSETDIVIAPSAAIIRCGGIFEKALYSAEVLSDEERNEFSDLVEKIILSV
jgi:hypothetical protein